MLSELQIRWDAISHVLALREKWWAAIPASALKSFISDGQQILLKGIQGVFKPKEISEPISILSTLSSPYTDTLLDGQKILYDFAPLSRDYDNDGLKRCAEKRLPLIYLLQLKGKSRPEYQVFAPVKVVGWDDVERRFTIDLQPRIEDFLDEAAAVTPIADSRLGEQIVKGYAISPVARRLHQAKFSGSNPRRLPRALCSLRPASSSAARCSSCGCRSRPQTDDRRQRRAVALRHAPPRL